MRFPTQDLQQRLLQNGGRVPFGLWRPNQWRALPRRPRNQDDPLARLVNELRLMLRDLTNLNVRQPSHLAPPFRAVPFIFQRQFTAGVTNIPLPINGNDAVPAGTQGVVTRVQWTSVPGLTFTGTDYWSVGSPALTIYRNALPLPGYLNLQVSFRREHSTIDAGGLFSDSGIAAIEPPVPATIILAERDALSFDIVKAAGFDGVEYLQVEGYFYPIETSGDGVRGTLADRG